MNALKLLGVGLLQDSMKNKGQYSKNFKLEVAKKNASVTKFIKKILGTRLIHTEKKIKHKPS